MDTFKTIDEYINSFPKDVRDILQTLRQTAPLSSHSQNSTVSIKRKSRKIVIINI